MTDNTGIASSIALLKAQAAGGTQGALGSLTDKSSAAAYVAGTQALIAAESREGVNSGVDFGNVAFASAIIREVFVSDLEISGTPVEEGVVDTPYTGFTVTATGGQTPYTYTVHEGALPTGITLNPSTGVVAGTPTVEETQTGIVIRVTDAWADTDDLAAFEIAVAAA